MLIYNTAINAEKKITGEKFYFKNPIIYSARSPNL